MFTILFLWQLPHFLAIADRYRTDYARAGLAMLTVEASELVVGRQAITYAVYLLLVTLLPALWDAVGLVYLAVATVAGMAYLWLSFPLLHSRSPDISRRLFRYSLVYLPVVFGTLSWDGMSRLDESQARLSNGASPTMVVDLNVALTPWGEPNSPRSATPRPTTTNHDGSEKESE